MFAVNAAEARVRSSSLAASCLFLPPFPPGMTSPASSFASCAYAAPEGKSGQKSESVLLHPSLV